MFNAITASNDIKDEFIGYITTHFHIADKEYEEQFRRALRQPDALTKGPYLDISDSYQTGGNIEQLIEDGELSPLFRSLEGNIPDDEKELQIYRKLYLHQEKAVRKINQGRNLIITTGTGSGKTECFVIPIINFLLREAEQGKLDPGVRAILIYPMNALANDQMKRLRNLLKCYPDITFGVYNSSTKYTDREGIIEYGTVYKDENGQPLKPLPNEIISREKMQQSPPHILVTNYAMLEYMMLRPKDDLVFSKAKLRFLVLDEAHTYRGATGMETSLLLKRLKARISNPSNVLHILTSATLGGEDADDDIIRFASTLCNADFYPDDIIRAKGIVPAYDDVPMLDIPLSMFADLANPEKPLNEIAQDYCVPFPEGQSDESFLYDLCAGSEIYRRLRENVSKPLPIDKIASLLTGKYNVTEQDVVNIVTVAEQAAKNNTALIRARYHMFAKALEGGYITVGHEKILVLDRKYDTQINGETQRLFECAVCNNCGRIAVTGKEIDGVLVFASDSNDPQIEYYLICEKNDGNLDDEIADDGEDEENEEELGKNDFLLCSRCGAITHKSQASHLPCSCGREYYINVRKAQKTEIRGDGKCPCCSSGKFHSFYLGYDAATAVLGTALFETLPEREKKLRSKKPGEVSAKKLFGGSRQSNQVDVIKRKRQFLSFSDSRGEAAFFASYMTKSYQEFLRRRGIWHVVEKNAADMATNPWEIKDFVDELTAYFDSERTFAKPGAAESENLTSVSNRNAWVAVLNEMVNARRSTSLVSLGVLRFNYKGNGEEEMAGAAEQYNMNVQDMKALFDLMVMDIVYFGAIQGECSLLDDEREYIYYTTVPKRIKKCKDINKDKNKTYLASWIAMEKKNGNLQKNGRLNRVIQTLGISETDANNLLGIYWDEILMGRESLTSQKGEDFYFETNRFTVSAGSETVPVYICNVCGKTSMINCKNMCPTIRCPGTLKRISQAELQEKNHFAKLYSSSLMQPLHIKEHTAQLGREEQQKYQEMFVNKELNALSCSTTFELGVDVGDLETVYLRNMPPTPANYVQRAGRAGRSRDSAAFALTYAKLSSHDFTFYNHPENTIMGKIGVPLFTVNNEKVILRHIYAVTLSDFFAKNPDVYNKNDANILLNENGWERFCDYLQEKPEDLKSILKASIPEDMHSSIGIDDYSWMDRLIGDDGVMKIAVDDFRNTVSFYEKEYKRLKKNNDIQAAARIERILYSYRRKPEDNRGKNDLIEFLVRNNILPKYGFPIDTVELYQNMNDPSEKKLQMVRDLQLAISEYAPGSQVVADDKLYTSRYIRKLPQTTGQDWETVYIAICTNPSCETWNHRTIEPLDDEAECVSCHQKIPRKNWMPAIEPRKGFTAENRPKEVPMRKPNKAYRSDVFYIGDPQRNVIDKYSFVTAEGLQFQMETSTNDSLMVVCNETFYVCPNCGFAESISAKKESARFNSHQKSIKDPHVTPWGKTCDTSMVKNKLCHVFKTDVVQLIFSIETSGNLETMLSVMYALLEALSSELDIERNDIDGCLHKVRYQDKLVYSIILYDSVAGGAGHVRRLVSNNGAVFSRVVNRAVEITKNCKCDPSCYNCLRNYYNEKVHDLLDRKLAYQFLENLCCDFEPSENEE